MDQEIPNIPSGFGETFESLTPLWAPLPIAHDIRLLWSVCHHGTMLEFDSTPASSVKSVHSAQSDFTDFSV